MQFFYAKGFVDIILLQHKLELWSKEESDDPRRLMATDDDHDRLFKILIDQCTEIGLTQSAECVEEVFQYMRTPRSISDLGHRFEEIRRSILRELKHEVFFHMSQDVVKTYYRNQNFFGDEVSAKFSSADFDVKEAARCFAVERHTASVMHLQRVMEAGLIAYGTFLNLPCIQQGRQPDWGRVLEQAAKTIKDRNDKNNKTVNWLDDAHRTFCERIQPFLESVKVAWRNPSMHVEGKYTGEEALEIYNAVKAFMRHLAAHLDEQGVFTA